MIGRWYGLIIDCPDPSALAGFYEKLLGMARVEESPDWVTIGGPGRQPDIAFQKVQDFRPPRWPDPGSPQQLHIDVMVTDLDVAERQILWLGARLLEGSAKSIGYRVYADPAGHPFCLVTPESLVMPG
jgi:hypothetical protein